MFDEEDESWTVNEMIERPGIFDPNDYDEQQARILDMDGFTFWEEGEDEC